MKTKRLSGKFIVFEGIDGSGKTTLAKNLHEHLSKKKLNPHFLFEPTKGTYGKKLRDSFTGERLPLEEEYRLFTMDRKDDLENNILPALRFGKPVILDRYYYSTAAYQGARGLDWEKIIKEQEEFAYRPDLLFLIDVPVEIATKRILQSRDGTNSFEHENYLREVYSIFHLMKYPYMRMLDGTRSIEELSKSIAEAVDVLIFSDNH